MHIAIVYNDIKSVKLLIKHGVDVNKRVTGDYNTTGQERIKDDSTKRKRQATRTLFQRNQSAAKQFNPQSENPESTQTSVHDFSEINDALLMLCRSCLLR